LKIGSLTVEILKIAALKIVGKAILVIGSIQSVENDPVGFNA
jgi:hypothetical protein